MLLFGVAMVGIMVWRPRGIVGTRSPTIVLRKAEPIPKHMVEEARV
jgi:branched-chain amino acid transport system permease protein